MYDVEPETDTIHYIVEELITFYIELLNDNHNCDATVMHDVIMPQHMTSLIVVNGLTT